MQSEAVALFKGILTGSPGMSPVPLQGVQAAAFLQELKSVSNWCKHHADTLTILSKSIGREDMYNLLGFTVDSIRLHIQVLSDEGFQWLQRDIQSGLIGQRLGELLVSAETKARFQNSIIFDVNLVETGGRLETLLPPQSSDIPESDVTSALMTVHSESHQEVPVSSGADRQIQDDLESEVSQTEKPSAVVGAQGSDIPESDVTSALTTVHSESHQEVPVSSGAGRKIQDDLEEVSQTEKPSAVVGAQDSDIPESDVTSALTTVHSESHQEVPVSSGADRKIQDDLESEVSQTEKPSAVVGAQGSDIPESDVTSALTTVHSESHQEVPVSSGADRKIQDDLESEVSQTEKPSAVVGAQGSDIPESDVTSALTTVHSESHQEVPVSSGADRKIQDDLESEVSQTEKPSAVVGAQGSDIPESDVTSALTTVHSESHQEVPVSSGADRKIQDDLESDVSQTEKPSAVVGAQGSDIPESDLTSALTTVHSESHQEVPVSSGADRKIQDDLESEVSQTEKPSAVVGAQGSDIPESDVTSALTTVHSESHQEVPVSSGADRKIQDDLESEVSQTEKPSAVVGAQGSDISESDVTSALTTVHSESHQEVPVSSGADRKIQDDLESEVSQTEKPSAVVGAQGSDIPESDVTSALTTVHSESHQEVPVSSGADRKIQDDLESEVSQTEKPSAVVGATSEESQESKY